MIAELAVQTPAELEQEAPAFLTWAKELAVTTPEEFEDAGNRLKEIKGAMKRVADFFRPMKQKADETKKAILDAEKKLSVPLADAENLAKSAMLTYQRAEEEKRLAEQRRLQAEADERARLERERLLKQEAKVKSPERKQAYAEQAAAVIAPVVQVPTAAPKVAGVVTKKIWRARVVDPLKVPREFLIVDERKLDQYAKAMKEGASVPGVEFFTETTMAASGR